MAASPKMARGTGTESMVVAHHWWVMMEAGELHLGVTSAPVGGVPPLPHLLSMARHHPSGENTLWPDITQPTTRRNRGLKLQKSDPAIHRNQGGLFCR